MYEGIDGFLGTRASLMLDVVFLAMFAVVPAIGLGIWLVKYRQAYLLHKRIQLTLAAVLAATVTLFEIDIRIHGWRDRAAESAYYNAGLTWHWVNLSLAIHLVFAVSTAVLWIVVVTRALRHFPSPPAPGPHSSSHIFWARLAAIDMGLTAGTGWIFYLLAFVL